MHTLGVVLVHGLVAWWSAIAANVWLSGPGFESPDLVLPCRYFFARLVDDNGLPLENSDGRDVQVRFLNTDCDVMSRVYDSKEEDLYNVRMVFRSSCANVTFRFVFTDNNEPIGDPVFLDGPLDADDCDCPMVSVRQWMSKARCDENNLVQSIDDQLSPWPKGSIDFGQALDEAVRKWGRAVNSYSFVYYRIRSNKLYKKAYGTYTGFSMFSDDILLSIMRKVKLPNMDFLLNLGDWPLESKRAASQPPVPIFSWCVSNDTYDIVLPTYEQMLNILRYNFTYNEDLLSVGQLRQVEWKDKKPKAFWRGRDSRSERLLLVNMSRLHPDLLDAAITHFFFFDDVKHLYQPTVKTVPFRSFFNYKYQVNVDGTVAAYRLTLLLAGNSVVLKQQSKYSEHYYRLLQPWEHYIPVESDLSDLLDKIRWAKDNENQVLRIIRNAHRLLMDHLLPREVYCYHVATLTKYADRLKRPLEDGDQHSFQLVEQRPPQQATRCSCASRDTTREEL